ncbi:MAG: Na+/H+ antiporter NhaC [Gammaproteobacteria bacterium]|jgi:Na+:H+ antiporter, NhaC family|nr:Na+/H+ antiporter NhaC [Gammaproteobacteria bacterium]
MTGIQVVNEHDEPKFVAALICCLGVLAIIICSVFVLEIELHLALTIALIWTAFNAAVLGYRFRDTKKLMNDGIIAAVGAIYIFMLIGVVIAALIESGTIAGIIFYALDVVDPRWFLPASLLLCSFMSLATGTSWGTVGTAGVVLVGLGEFIGIPAPMVAGAVISGALFGDKMSPLSDTTILAATAVGTEVDQHIRAMFYTTGPTFLLILIVFGALSFSYGNVELSLAEIDALRGPLLDQFSMNFLVFLPLLVILTMSFMRMAAEPSMMAGTIVAVLLAMYLQGREFSDILYSLQYGFVSESGIESVDTLLTRGGLQSMMWTLSLALIALALGGVLNGAGFLKVLVRGLIKRIKTTTQLVTSTIATGILSNMSTGENYLTVIFGSRIYKDTYEERGLHPRMLSRCVEEGATLSAGLIPWTTTGAFFSGALGVSTVQYAPWVLLSSFNIIISIGLTAIGKGIFKQDQP